MSLSANYPTRGFRNWRDRIEIGKVVPCGTDDIRVDVDVRIPGLTDGEMALVESFVLRAAIRAAKHAAAGIIAARKVRLPA